MPTPAHLPPRPPTLTHPHQLWPVLPAPGWGLRARAASLSTSTRSQSSARMVEARTRPRPAAVPARLGLRGPPGWPAKGRAAERQQSAGQASSESGGAPAGGEQAERPPGAGTGEGAGRGGRGASGARLESSPALPAQTERSPRAPAAASQAGGGGWREEEGDRAGNPRAGRTPEEHQLPLHRTLAPACLPLLHSLGESGGEKARRARAQQGTAGAPSSDPGFLPSAPRPISTRLPDFLGCSTELCRDLMPTPTQGVSPCSRGLNSTPLMASLHFIPPRRHGDGDHPYFEITWTSSHPRKVTEVTLLFGDPRPPQGPTQSEESKETSHPNCHHLISRLWE